MISKWNVLLSPIEIIFGYTSTSMSFRSKNSQETLVTKHWFAFTGKLLPLLLSASRWNDGVTITLKSGHVWNTTGSRQYISLGHWPKWSLTCRKWSGEMIKQNAGQGDVHLRSIKKKKPINDIFLPLCKGGINLSETLLLILPAF